MTSVTVRGVPIRITDTAGAADQVASWVASGVRTYVSCASVHCVEEGHAREDVRLALHGAGMVLPDGAPVAFVARRLGASAAEQVTGSALFDAVLERADEIRHYFYGSSEDVLSDLLVRVHHLYPQAVIAGSYSPPFRALSSAEMQTICNAINDARPDIVWVGLGAPKQDLWMAEARQLLDAPVLVGVGAVFDFVSGHAKRAPLIWRRLGLEWFYRLLRSPRRLWRRYLTTNTTFAWAVMRALVAGVVARRS